MCSPLPAAVESPLPGHDGLGHDGHDRDGHDLDRQHIYLQCNVLNASIMIIM